MEANRSEVVLNPNCPCLAVGCPFHENCEKCRAYHHPQGEQTACERLKEESKRFSFARHTPNLGT